MAEDSWSATWGREGGHQGESRQSKLSPQPPQLGPEPSLVGQDIGYKGV